MPRTAYGCSRLLRWLPAVLTIVLLWTCLHYRTLWTHRTLRTLGDSQTPGQTAGRTIRDTDTDTNTVLNQHNDIHVADSESNDVRKDIEIRGMYAMYTCSLCNCCTVISHRLCCDITSDRCDISVVIYIIIMFSGL